MSRNEGATMTMHTFPVHISAGGEVSPIPDWPGGEAEAEITVHLPSNRENLPDDDCMDDDWRPDPAAVRRFHEIRKLLPPVEITDEEIEQLKHERRMRKML